MPLFQKGDRVKLSDAGIAAGIDRRIRKSGLDRVGTVIGFSRDKLCVWVRWDGYHKQGVAYSRRFLVLIQNAAISGANK